MRLDQLMSLAERGQGLALKPYPATRDMKRIQMFVC